MPWKYWGRRRIVSPHSRIPILHIPTDQESIVSDGKPRIGVFKYSCCAGCEFQLIFFQKHVLETLGKVDIVFCRMLQSGGVEEGPFDVALIEGTITEQWQVEQLRKIRTVSKYVIPIGSCAVCGGVPGHQEQRAGVCDPEPGLRGHVENHVDPGPSGRPVRAGGRLYQGLPDGRARPGGVRDLAAAWASGRSSSNTPCVSSASSSTTSACWSRTTGPAWGR